MNTPIDISAVTLKTKRLTLRPFCESDLDDLYAYASVDGVGQMAGWKPHEKKSDSAVVLNIFIVNKNTFALVYEDKVIGSIGIDEYDEGKYPEFADKKCRELGFVLSKDHWGQGLMPEALQAVIRFLFDKIGLDAIMCEHFADNLQSKRVQEKCGFRPYAADVQQTYDGTSIACLMNILNKNDYRNQ